MRDFMPCKGCDEPEACEIEGRCLEPAPSLPSRFEDGDLPAADVAAKPQYAFSRRAVINIVRRRDEQWRSAIGASPLDSPMEGDAGGGRGAPGTVTLPTGDVLREGVDYEARHMTQCKHYENNCGAVHPSNCPDCPFRTAGVGGTDGR